MCEPTTIAVVGAGLAVGGGILKADAAKKAASENASIDLTNALVARMSAGDARGRGDQAATLSLLHSGAATGQAAAQLAGSGIDVTQGSAANNLADRAAMGALDAATLRNNAAREAWGYERQADNFTRKAQLDMDTGNAQATDAILGGITQGFSIGSKAIPVK